MALDKNYWDARWVEGHTGWDLKGISPAIQLYIDQEVHKDSSILIPGCGNAYEAQYLVEKGVREIHLLDISPSICKKLENQFPQENVHVHCTDFFTHKGQYDFILEQTFFCALEPAHREDYTRKIKSLLGPRGTLFGLLFDTTFEKEGPPFGGSAEEYKTLFSQTFSTVNIQETSHSIAPRQGTEVFLIAR